MAETSKAYERRLRDGFFDKYIHGKGIDIGCGRFDTHDGIDLIDPTAIPHDKDICDAHTMSAYADEEFDYTYASHILEHLNDPVQAIQNWYRITRMYGFIIISIPHRDLYERKRMLPSKWNTDHKYFYLEDECDPPHTFSFRGLIKHALKNRPHEILELKTHNSCTNLDKPEEHGNGEYCIEVVIRKFVI